MNKPPDELNRVLKSIPGDSSDIRALHRKIASGTKKPPISIDASSEGEVDNELLEDRIAAIWESMLHREAIDRDSDFFEIGGDSILAVQVLSKMRSELNVTLSLGEMLDGKLSINDLSAKIANHYRH